MPSTDSRTTSGRGKAPTSAQWTARCTSTCTPPRNTTGCSKKAGYDNVTTIYMGEGPLEKYQTTGRIDATDWHTGQSRTNVPVIMCTHIQVVYGGNNITSPSTCAQANFS